MQIAGPIGVDNNCCIQTLDSTCTCHPYDKALSFEENTYNEYFNLTVYCVITHAHMTVPFVDD